jgi:hypothetical protein
LTSYSGAVENWRVGADEYTEDFPNHNYFRGESSTLLPHHKNNLFSDLAANIV